MKNDHLYRRLQYTTTQLSLSTFLRLLRIFCFGLLFFFLGMLAHRYFLVHFGLLFHTRPVTFPCLSFCRAVFLFRVLNTVLTINLTHPRFCSFFFKFLLFPVFSPTHTHTPKNASRSHATFFTLTFHLSYLEGFFHPFSSLPSIVD